MKPIMTFGYVRTVFFLVNLIEKDVGRAADDCKGSFFSSAAHNLTSKFLFQVLLESVTVTVRLLLEMTTPALERDLVGGKLTQNERLQLWTR